MTLFWEERVRRVRRRVIQIINFIIIIRVGLYDNLNDLKDMMMKENAIAIDRISFNSLVISQQNDMINLLISRNASLLCKFTYQVNHLCQAMIDMMGKVDTCEDIIHAKQQVQAEEREWLQLEHQINTRREVLIAKCKGRGSKHRHHGLKSKHNEFVNDSRKSSKYNPSLEPVSNTDYKTRIRNEFTVIKQFVSTNLSPKLQYHLNSQTPKKIILNIYLRWNRQVQRTLQFSDTAKIQMELTNQLKICFPKMQMTRTTFKGIQFRPELMEEHIYLTDKSPPFGEDDNLIDEDCLDSIDDILDNYPQTKQEGSQE